MTGEELRKIGWGEEMATGELARDLKLGDFASVSAKTRCGVWTIHVEAVDICWGAVRSVER